MDTRGSGIGSSSSLHSGVFPDRESASEASRELASSGYATRISDNQGYVLLEAQKVTAIDAESVQKFTEEVLTIFHLARRLYRHLCNPGQQHGPAPARIPPAGWRNAGPDSVRHPCVRGVQLVPFEHVQRRKLRVDVTFKSTAATAPVVASTTPAAGATGVAVTIAPSATFDQTMATPYTWTFTTAAKRGGGP